MDKYKVVDLFAGAGGLSYGFLQTGKFQVVAAAEINKNARATYKANIADEVSGFAFIDNVIGCDFRKLNCELQGIDVVIGGPPCQGFSNANRQKNHLISMNNGLVKEFFRAIKEIRPTAFVMENVSMLRSDTHRFYESYKDNFEIDALIKSGHKIQKRSEKIVVSDQKFEGIDYKHIADFEIKKIKLPTKLQKLLSVLNKNKNNPLRLPKYLKKHGLEISKQINAYISSVSDADIAQQHMISQLLTIKNSVEAEKIIISQ